MMKIVHVVGARPNFMKAAPVLEAIRSRLGWPQVLLHTGQHYDHNMSEIFFHQLGMPRPDVNLGVGSGSHAQQTAEIMVQLERLLVEDRPGMVLVYGDVNSTVAAALVCAKEGIRLAHVEAGLRSFDRSMPEEVNRIITDQLADVLFTPSRDGDENLLREGIAAEKIHFVGNVMIDTLIRLLPIAAERFQDLQRRLMLGDSHYGLLTLHRPSNVDNPATLNSLLTTINDLAASLPIIFPVHPRTLQSLGTDGGLISNLKVVEPLGYLEFLALQQRATAIITDSGGIQEEASYLGVPCFTLRENTERPITVTEGTNLLVGRDMELLRSELDKVLAGERRKFRRPPLWDGKASERIANILFS